MAASKYKLGENPLFKQEQEEKKPEQEEQEKVFTPEQEAEILKQDKKKGRPKNENLVRYGSQAGLPKESTRATFIIDTDVLEDVKNYAYTERLKLKDVINDFLKKGIEAYKEAGGELLDRNKR